MAERAGRARARAFLVRTRCEYAGRRLRICGSPTEAEGERAAMHGHPEAEDHLRSQRVLLCMTIIPNTPWRACQFSSPSVTSALTARLDSPWHESQPMTFFVLQDGDVRQPQRPGARWHSRPRSNRADPMRCRAAEGTTTVFDTHREDDQAATSQPRACAGGHRRQTAAAAAGGPPRTLRRRLGSGLDEAQQQSAPAAAGAAERARRRSDAAPMHAAAVSEVSSSLAGP